MPQRRHLYSFALAVMTMGTAAWLFLLISQNGSRPAVAAPHVISPKLHGYDLDWPRVFWILANKCQRCHRPQAKTSDLTSYERLMAAKSADGTKVVIPGNPADSLLFDYSNWNAHARPNSDLPDQPMMPPDDKDDWLTSGELRTIYRWIKNGARQYARVRQYASRRAPIAKNKLIETDFPSARQCKGCHPKQYREWSRSMHAYAQHSPVFEAFNLSLIERTGGTIGTFCSRCHTPLGTALGENGSRRNVHRSRLSMEGISCVVCHRRPAGHYKANARVAIQPGKLLDTCMYGPFEDKASASKATHKSQSKAYIRTSQFCGECHDVTSPAGLRLEEAFSEWHNSPAAKQGITCQHCHMGPVQGLPIARDKRPLGRAATVPGVDPKHLPLRRLSDHTFAGPDYSLLPDTEFPRKLDFMYEERYYGPHARLTPFKQKRLNELRRHNRRENKIYREKRLELLSHSAKLTVRHPKQIARGSSLPVRVDVTNKISGHHFPTGFTAERQLWIDIEVIDRSGRTILRSGDLDKNGDLRDDHSHEVLSGKIPFDRHLLNFQNKFIARTNKGTERSVVVSVNRHIRPLNFFRPSAHIAASNGRPADFRIAKGSLPPLRTLGKTYAVTLPDCDNVYRIRVKLNFRHLPPTLLDHVGIPHLKHLLEVVTLDKYEAFITATGR